MLHGGVEGGGQVQEDGGGRNVAVGGCDRPVFALQFTKDESFSKFEWIESNSGIERCLQDHCMRREAGKR